MSHFLFVRHGQSQANANHIIGDSHSPLTTLGQEQAKQTAGALRDEKIATIIICSPYTRAQQTARIIAAELGLTPDSIQILDDLSERHYGPLFNQPRDRETSWYYTGQLPGVESPAELFARMNRCLETLKQLAAQELVLVVGHAVSGFYLMQIAAHKISIQTFDQPKDIPNAGIVTITF